MGLLFGGSLLWHPCGTRDTLKYRVHALCIKAMWHPCTLKSEKFYAMNVAVLRQFRRVFPGLSQKQAFAITKVEGYELNVWNLLIFRRIFAMSKGTNDFPETKKEINLININIIN